jgi:hypothetical protein
MAKYKQVVEVESKKINVGSLGLKDSTFKEMSQSMKKESKLKTLPHLRHIVLMGEFKGEMAQNGVTGFWFKKNEENVVVDITNNTFLAAFVDQKEPLIKPKETKTIQKESAIEKHQSKIIEINGLKVDVTQITPSEHYLERAKKRFEVTDKNKAVEFFQDIMINGEYLGITYDRVSMKKAHLFAKDNKAIFVSIDFDVVMTTYKQETVVHEHPKYEIKEFLQKKINRLRKVDSRLHKKLELTELEVNKEIAELKLLLHRAKSESKKYVYQGRINALQMHKNQVESDRRLVANQLREYTNSLISFV